MMTKACLQELLLGRRSNIIDGQLYVRIVIVKDRAIVHRNENYHVTLVLTRLLCSIVLARPPGTLVSKTAKVTTSFTLPYFLHPTTTRFDLSGSRRNDTSRRIVALFSYPIDTLRKHVGSRSRDAPRADRGFQGGRKEDYGRVQKLGYVFNATTTATSQPILPISFFLSIPLIFLLKLHQLQRSM